MSGHLVSRDTRHLVNMPPSQVHNRRKWTLLRLFRFSTFHDNHRRRHWSPISPALCQGNSIYQWTVDSLRLDEILQRTLIKSESVVCPKHEAASGPGLSYGKQQHSFFMGQNRSQGGRKLFCTEAQSSVACMHHKARSKETYFFPFNCAPLPITTWGTKPTMIYNLSFHPCKLHSTTRVNTIQSFAVSSPEYCLEFQMCLGIQIGSTASNVISRGNPCSY